MSLHCIINSMQGRIIKIISNQYTIEYDKQFVVAWPRGKMRKGQAPVVGDWVEFSAIDDRYVIEKILPRSNRLLRPAIANVDQALIVTSMKDPDYACHLLNRLIFLVSLSHVEPVICITKADLVDMAKYQAEMAWYEKAGYTIVYTYPGSDDKDLKKVFRSEIGLGTQATRAQIIETLLKRSYIVRSAKNLLATEKGIMLVDKLSLMPNTKDLTSVSQTANLEQKLQSMAEGEIDDKLFLADINSFITNATKDRKSVV